MAEQHSLTIQQSQQVARDLSEMQVLAVGTAQLLAATFGLFDNRTIRAGEVAAAVQRLTWALERADEGRAAKAAASG
jgi:hypothetical protein